MALDEAPARCEKTPGEEEESGLQVTPPPGLSPTPSHQEDHTEEQHLQFLVSDSSFIISYYIIIISPPQACSTFPVLE